MLETELLLKYDELSEGKDLQEAQMIKNHKAAIEFLLNAAESIDINTFTVRNLHALLANDLFQDSRANTPPANYRI